MDKINGLNGDINRREQIIFGCDFNKNNDKDFKKDWEKASKSDDIFATGAVIDSYYVGGIKKFKNLSLEQLKTLVKEEFIDPEAQQNTSPSVAQFIRLANTLYDMEYSDNLELQFIGFAISPDRDDYGVQIEGVSYSSSDGYRIDREIIKEFWEFIKNADEVEVNESSGRGWWD